MDDKAILGKGSRGAEPGVEQAGERIAKVIARAGLASRREAEAWIAAGRVAVNGAVIPSPALNVTANDRISVDGEPLPARERTRLFLYHKPRGLITSRSDPQGRPTIFAQLPSTLPRLVGIGRLDFNTEGLLLLTNDGALARILELPETGWLRRYRVRAHGAVTQPELDALRAGVTIDGIRYGAIEATLDRLQGSNLWLTLAIREGKNREVRNVLGHLGLTVNRLIRVSFGPFQLGELAAGAVEEVRTRVLREQLGERVAALAGADFSAPLTPPPAQTDEPRPRAQKSKRRDKERAGGGDSRAPARRSEPDHSWRTPDTERGGKTLRRKYHGAGRDNESRDNEESKQAGNGKARAGVLKDRHGRRVLVERYGEAPRPEPAAETKPRGGKGRSEHHRSHYPKRHRSPDRAGGPRPRRPKGR